MSELNFVDQTILGVEGNCMSACWASILGVPIEEVPDPAAIHKSGKNWLRVVNQWLKQFDLAYIEIKVDAFDYYFPQGYHLIGGQSHRGTKGGHAVVGFAGKMVHDPHPDKSGLTVIEDYGFLVKLSTQSALAAAQERERELEEVVSKLATALDDCCIHLKYYEKTDQGEKDYTIIDIRRDGLKALEAATAINEQMEEGK